MKIKVRRRGADGKLQGGLLKKPKKAAPKKPKRAVLSESDDSDSDFDLAMGVMGGDEGGDEYSFDCCGKSLHVLAVGWHLYMHDSHSPCFAGKMIHISHDVEDSYEMVGGAIWPSSMVIAKYFELILLPALPPKDLGDGVVEGGNLKGKHILEIGAGVGLTGIALASMGARVLLTDYKEEILVRLRENIMLNNLDRRVKTSLLDWTDKKNHRKRQKKQGVYDYIILADVLYYDTGAAPGLIPMLLAMAAKETQIYLAYEDRKNEASLPFFDRAREHFDLEQLVIPPAVLKSAKLPNSVVHSSESKPVRLYQLVLRNMGNQ
jgi:hypothetical protein